MSFRKTIIVSAMTILGAYALSYVTFGSLKHAAIAHAQEAPAQNGPAQPPPGMTREQAAEINATLQQLRDALEVNAKAQQVQKQQAAAPPTDPAAATAASTAEKTLATVADRALTIAESAFAKIASQMEKIAPQVWRVMIRQQYVKAVADLVMPLGWLLCAIGYYFLIARKGMLPKIEWRSRWEDWFFWLGVVMPTVIGGISFLAFCGAISDSVRYLINPEYYAVKDLMLLLTNPSSAALQ